MSDEDPEVLVEGKFKAIKEKVKDDEDDDEEDEDEEDKPSFLEKIFSNWDSATILEELFGTRRRSEKRREDRRRKISRRHQDSDEDSGEE